MFLMALLSAKQQIKISSRKINSDDYWRWVNILKAWWITCNKAVAAIAVAIIIIAIILTVITYNVDKKNESSIGTLNTVPESSNRCKIMHKGECEVECSNFADNELMEVLPNEFNSLNLKSCSSLQLTLRSVNCPNGTIQRNWLKNLNKSIQSLFIQSSNLMVIDDYAFAGYPFTELVYLNLYDTAITRLRKLSFANMSLVKFEFSSLNAITVDKNVFDGTAASLENVQFLQSLQHLDVLHNITGAYGSTLDQVMELDLRYNSLTKLTNNIFANTLNVKAIYLESAGLEQLESSTFYRLNQLVDLHLSGNRFTTLPDGIFDFMSNGKISISSNPWNCNCDLIWMHDFYTANEDLFADVFECYENGDFVDYDTVDFCPDGNNSTKTTRTSTLPTTSTVITTLSPKSTTSQSTTTKSTATTSSYFDPDLIEINCKDPAGSNPLSQIDLHRVYSHTVSVRQKTILFHFYQLEDQPTFELIIEGDVSAESLLLLNTGNMSELSCLSNLQKSALLEKLAYGQTYTVCLLRPNETGVSPYDCTSIGVPQAWDSRTWIPNKMKTGVICAVCGCLAATVLITSLTVYYYMRRRSDLTESRRERVLLDRCFQRKLSRSLHTFVPPPPPPPRTYYDSLRLKAESFKSYSDGYLTPMNKVYAEPISVISENTNPSMTSTAVLTDSQINAGKILEVFNEKHGDFNECESPLPPQQKQPPPLPPNHPAKKISKNCTEYM